MKKVKKLMASLLIFAMMAAFGMPSYAEWPDPDIELVRFDTFDNNVSTNQTVGWITNTGSDRFSIQDNHLVMTNPGTSSSGNLASIIYYFNGAGLSSKNDCPVLKSGRIPYS